MIQRPQTEASAPRICGGSIVRPPANHPGGCGLDLCQAGVGCDLVIEVVDGPHCDRLRDLGFCESLPVRKVADGRNLICSICGTRVAISRELAAEVKVRPR